MKVVARPAQAAPLRAADTEALAPKAESKSAAAAKPSIAQTTVTPLQAVPAETQPAQRSAVEKESPRVNAPQRDVSPPVARTAKSEPTEKAILHTLPAQDSVPAKETRSHRTPEASRASVTPAPAVRRNPTPITLPNARTEPRVSRAATPPLTQAVPDAVPKEIKISAPPLSAPVEQEVPRVMGQTPVLTSFDAPRERMSEPQPGVQSARIVPPPTEKQPHSDFPANSSVRISDLPRTTDAPDLNRESAPTLRVTQAVLPPDSPMPASSMISGKPVAESTVNSAAARPAQASGEPTHTAAPSPETASEHPSAGAASNATTRETLARVEAAVPTPRTRLTVEQIRELQALVSRAMQSSQAMADGSARATFNWAPEGFGALRFSIISRDAGVRIEISSDRREVVKALEEGRANMERVIADLGMRMERFEVRLRAPEFTDTLPPPQQDGRYPERNSNAEPGGGDAAFIERSMEASPEDAEPARRYSLAEHEWVA
jgi:hypothetical protein